MEYRYVYRAIEDAIGSKKEVKKSPHSMITARLRQEFMECRDFAHHLEVKLACMSAFAGNPRIDAEKLIGGLINDIDNILSTKMPYMKPDDEDEEKPDNDTYFSMLEEFDKELKEKKANDEGNIQATGLAS